MQRKKKDGSTLDFEIPLKEINLMLGAYASIMSAILQKEVSGEKVFSTKNIVGEYAELLCCEKMKLVQEVASNKAYDAVDTFGNKYQIKARQQLSYASANGEDQMGDIKESALDNIDRIITILFDDNFKITAAFLINPEAFKTYADIIKGTETKYRLRLNNKTIRLLETEPQGVQNIKDLLEK